VLFTHLSVYRDILKETYNAKKLWNGLDFFSGFKQNPEVCTDVNVLILEDNVALCSRSVMQEQALDSIASFVSKPDFEWDVIHLCKVQFLVSRVRWWMLKLRSVFPTLLFQLHSSISIHSLHPICPRPKGLANVRQENRESVDGWCGQRSRNNSLHN
jgi:hypothetical protein